MRDVAVLLNEMRDAGIILNYALFGASAQMRYTEAVMTLDADILVSLPNPDRMDVLKPVYDFCAQKGYFPEGEAIRVGAWPVQVVPVFSPLTQESLEQADTADFEGVPFRVVKAIHLAAIALSVGRPKDLTRILALIESGSVDCQALSLMTDRFGLTEAWERFQRRFLND